MIVITGLITTKDPNDAPALLADLRSGIARTRGEDGCLFYAFGMADEAAGAIIAAERWRDEDALATHLATPEVAALMANWNGKMTLDVVKHDATNERPLP